MRGFERIPINFVNEKLRQFFNRHMFGVGRGEYVGEGINGAMVDFGMDLAACVFRKAESATDKSAHFACVHYAGTIACDVTGRLDKNKDPVNETNNLMKYVCRLQITRKML